MSYTIEVYRGNQKAERHLGIYALYVMFYPQLVAGPIERPQNVIHQFYENHKFDYNNVTSGLKLMAWGLFKKVVIADILALAVNTVYDNPTNFFGLPLVIATFFFSIQIYCDFSGYSDIAIGSARVMGFRLMKNFDRPYLSKSVSEFWKRWHISLSTWFRDYLYIPLGGNRVNISRMYLNLMITFIISGLWHGANWTYIMWGAINGLYIITESIIYQKTSSRKQTLKSDIFFPVNQFLKIFFTFCLITFSWIFFRAANISDALYILENLFTNFQESISVVLSPKMGIDKFDSVGILYSLSILLSVEVFQSRYNITKYLKLQSLIIRSLLYLSLIATIIFTGYFDSEQQFIYFQF